MVFEKIPGAGEYSGRAEKEKVRKIRLTKDLVQDAEGFMAAMGDEKGLKEIEGKNEEEILAILSRKRQEAEPIGPLGSEANEEYENAISVLLDHHLTRLDRYYRDKNKES